MIGCCSKLLPTIVFTDAPAGSVELTCKTIKGGFKTFASSAACK